jgi:hypothetical protein
VRPLNSLSALELAGGENGALPFWSPDGQWIGARSRGPQTDDFSSWKPALSLAKTVRKFSSEGATTPRWRRDGRELFFCRIDGVLMAADVAPGKDSFVVGSIKPLSERRVFQTFYSATYDVFPDGQRFIMAAVKPEAIHAPLTLVTNWTGELKK